MASARGSSPPKFLFGSYLVLGSEHFPEGQDAPNATDELATAGLVPYSHIPRASSACAILPTERSVRTPSPGQCEERSNAGLAPRGIAWVQGPRRWAGP